MHLSGHFKYKYRTNCHEMHLKMTMSIWRGKKKYLKVSGTTGQSSWVRRRKVRWNTSLRSPPINWPVRRSRWWWMLTRWWRFCWRLRAIWGKRRACRGTMWRWSRRKASSRRSCSALRKGWKRSSMNGDSWASISSRWRRTTSTAEKMNEGSEERVKPPHLPVSDIITTYSWALTSRYLRQISTLLNNIAKIF